MHASIVSQRQLRTHFMRCLLKAVIASAVTGDRQGYMLTCECNMLRVAGGFSTVKLYNRIRGDRLRGVQKVTLNLIYLILFIEYYLACGPAGPQIGL